MQSLVPSPLSPSPPGADTSPPPLINFESPQPDNGRIKAEDVEARKSDEQDDISQPNEFDDEEDRREMEPLFEVAPLLKEEAKETQAGSVLSLRLENCGLRGQNLEVLGEPQTGFPLVENGILTPIRP